MSEVKLSVGGRDYTVACAEGEEAHVTMLGNQIDAKLQQLGAGRSTQESQNLLFGALFLADELHEATKSAAGVKADLEGQIASLTEAGREGALAIGQRDELKLTISRLESELEGLQSAQQKNAADADDLRSELETRRTQASDATQQAEKLTLQNEELQKENSTFASQIENKDLLLEKANTHIQELNAKVAAKAESGAFPVSSGTSTDDPDLAPALERFADLLESCADKLEGKAAST